MEETEEQLTLPLSLTRAHRPWFCYLLVTSDGKRQKTYVGATVDPAHRLRQHNGELSGGAKATHGRVWVRKFLIGGFTDERTALQFEWWWKKHTRDLEGSKFSFMERRIHALSMNLSNFPMAEVIEGID
jgi:predicted GIY-YIG superfamily endonuclease